MILQNGMGNSSQDTSYLKNLTVLVGEDDAIFMLVISKMLERKEATVLKAANGFEVLQFLDNNAYNVDIILLDLEMPQMNGYEAVKKIKEKFPSLPVLALTAHLIDSKMQSVLLDQEFSDVISKPFKPDLLYSKICEVVKK